MPGNHQTMSGKVLIPVGSNSQEIRRERETRALFLEEGVF